MKKEFSNDKEKNKVIAVFGGSFSPPTIAHIKIACEIYNKSKEVDEVWMIPCGDGRDDKKIDVECIKRIEMCEIIKKEIANDIPIKIDKTEYENGSFMQTYDLMKKLKEKYNNYKFMFVLGIDVVSDIINWGDGEKFLQEFDFIFTKRPGFDTEKILKSGCMLPKHFEILDMNIDGSSTEIRERIKSQIEQRKKKGNIKINYGISGLTSPGVVKFIVDNGYYGIKEK